MGNCYHCFFVVVVFYGSSAELGNMNVFGIAIVVVVAHDDADADDVLLESFDFYMRSN